MPFHEARYNGCTVFANPMLGVAKISQDLMLAQEISVDCIFFRGTFCLISLVTLPVGPICTNTTPPGRGPTAQHPALPAQLTEVRPALRTRAVTRTCLPLYSETTWPLCGPWPIATQREAVMHAIASSVPEI